MGDEMTTILLWARDHSDTFPWLRPLTFWLLFAWYSWREPDLIIYNADERVYLLRWYIKRTKEHSLYLHCFLGSDNLEVPHDHPGDSVSWILKGFYREHRGKPTGKAKRLWVVPEGDVVFRAAKAVHAIQYSGSPCWTLFEFGNITRQWGFWISPDTWVQSDKFEGKQQRAVYKDTDDRRY